VDVYTCIEDDRLSYIRCNQSTLRCELYNDLHDAINSRDNSACLIGKR